jgi:hypothetical protein
MKGRESRVVVGSRRSPTRGSESAAHGRSLAACAVASRSPASSEVMRLPPHDMALQRTRRPHFSSGRSVLSLGSPLTRHPFGGGDNAMLCGP